MLLTTLLTTLASLATSTTALSIAAPYSWHVSNLDAGCQNGQCSYLFDVSSPEYVDIPKFSAQCTARTMRRDSTYRPCSMGDGLMKRQSGPRRVEKVEAFLSLTPLVPQDTVFSVKVTANDGYVVRVGGLGVDDADQVFCRNGVDTWWFGNVTTQPYQYYEIQDQFNVIPVPGGSVAA